MIDYQQMLTARKLARELSEGNLIVDFSTQCDFDPIEKGSSVYNAVVEFKQTFVGKRLPHPFDKLFKRIQRLSIAQLPEACEAADDLIAELQRYACQEFTEPIDGPVEPHGFRWKGISYVLQPKQDKLLKAMWGKDYCLTIDVVEAVWGDYDPAKFDPSEALYSIISKVNTVLLEAKVPWCLSKRGDCILVKDELPKKVDTHN